MNVRELAAVDMHGTRGTTRRRRIILIEFVAGAVGLTAFGVVVLSAATSFWPFLIGLWLVGAGLNYIPLAVHVITLSRRGALQAALADVGLGEALAHYTVAQLWVFIPLALVVMDVNGRRRERIRRTTAS